MLLLFMPSAITLGYVSGICDNDWVSYPSYLRRWQGTIKPHPACTKEHLEDVAKQMKKAFKGLGESTKLPNCTPRHPTPRHATPRHATPRHATPRHATPRHATPRHATPPHPTPSHPIPSHPIPSHPITSHHIPHHIITLVLNLIF